MSAKASGYAKELVVCPSGELISAREKLVLMVLADSHQVKSGRFTFPSVDTIAAEARCDRRSCQRYLAALEAKGVIRRLRPANQGSGMNTFYFFPEIEAIPEGWQAAALFFSGRAAEGRQKGGIKGGKRAAESGLLLIERARAPEREQQQEQKQNTPQPPQAGEQGDHNQALLRAVDQVCSALSIDEGARRLRLLIRRQIALAMEKGEQAPTIALQMIAAVRDQDAMRLRGELKYKYGLRKFLEGGLWRDSNRWGWDVERMREMAAARVGMA